MYKLFIKDKLKLNCVRVSYKLAWRTYKNKLKTGCKQCHKQ